MHSHYNIYDEQDVFRWQMMWHKLMYILLEVSYVKRAWLL